VGDAGGENSNALDFVNFRGCISGRFLADPSLAHGKLAAGHNDTNQICNYSRKASCLTWTKKGNKNWGQTNLI
jgi:hypothetical protein